MKRPFDEELADSFKKLNQQLRLKSEPLEKLKESVLLQSQNSSKFTHSYKKLIFSTAVALLLLLGFSPMYSTTMASLAEKILKLEIKAVENSSSSMEFSVEMAELVERAGYQIGGMSTTVSPYTIRVGIMENGDSLPAVKDNLQSKIEQYLDNQGIDQYELIISIVKKEEEAVEVEDEIGVDMEKLDLIINEAMRFHGYPEFAQGVSFGMDNKQTLSLELPDTVTKIDEIREKIIDEVAQENLNVQKVDLTTYNEEERMQESLWQSTIGMDIYNALAGKSAYDVTGYSFGWVDGIAIVEIKTQLPKSTSKKILSDIEAAIQEYLASDVIQPQIEGDGYEIKILAKGNKSLLEVSKPPSE